LIDQSATYIVHLQPAFGGWPLLSALLGLSLLLTSSYATRLLSNLSATTAATKLMTLVPGVNKIAVSLEKRQTTLSFDDAKTHAEILTWVIQEAGYRPQPLRSSQ